MRVELSSKIVTCKNRKFIKIVDFIETDPNTNTYLWLEWVFKTMFSLHFSTHPSYFPIYSHYVRFGHHCRPHHCRICDKRQWCTFIAGYELENEKIIGARLKPATKDHITTGLWLEPAVFWRPLITAGLSQEPIVIGLYHCRFLTRTDGDKPTT